MGLKIVNNMKSDFTSNSSEEGPEMMRRGRKLPAGNPISGIGRIEEITSFDVVVERKVK
jgi:hypothetical protein